MSFQSVKYQIFISSTYTDLKDEREEVIKQILTYYHIPIGMEMFTADTDESWETIRETIESSDYYVLIIGHRYGTLTKEGISFTEKEYHLAASLSIPILVFVRDRNEPISNSKRESNAKLIRQLDTFIAEASKRHVSYWTNKQDLATLVMAALTKAFSRRPGVGWIRANGIANSDLVLQQISELTQENNRLEKLVAGFEMNHSPRFECSINGSTHVNFTIDDSVFPKESFFHTRMGEMRDSEDLRYENALKRAIGANREAIVQYNVEKLKYLRRHYFHSMVIEIKNVGTAISTENYIEITFPKEINVIKEGFALPEFKPSLSYDQYKEARILPELRHDYHRINSSHPKTSLTRDPNWSVKVDGNVVTVHISRLMHTRSVSILSLFWAMAEPVEHTSIDFSIICSEIRSPELINIPVKIYESQRVEELSEKFIHNKPDLEF